MRTAQPITEAVAHLEDLDLQAFIAAVSSISKMQATEKLDGAQLWLGLDEKGKLYTSRQGKVKTAERRYEETDYPYFSANNGFRAAHAALKAKEEDIKSVLRPGDTIEAEVLFGRQPNAVTYGAGGRNYIAFIRPVEGTQEIKVEQLTNRLSNQVVKVTVKVVDTTDGVNLDLTPTELAFQFVGVQKIDGAQLRQLDVSAQLAKLQKFLDKKADLKGLKLTNFELLTSSLGAIDKELRPAAKALKADLQAKVLTDFKLPIKKELLDRFVSKVRSPLTASDLSPDEDIGIEGVVLREPGSDTQIKLVDKDAFTTINQFNHSVRNTISGMVKTTDSGASLESRGGLVGELKITIADLLGNRELARTQGAKRVFATLRGTTPEQSIKNVANELTGGTDLLGTKKKIDALIGATLDKLDVKLKDFKANKDSFQLKLKSGKTIGLSPEVIRRTLLTFAEANRDLKELREKVKGVKSMAQLVAVLYGKVAKTVHAGGEEQLAEGQDVLLERRIFTDKSQYQNKDGWTLLNIYFATVMMAAVIYKANDAMGIRMLKDKTHCRLTKWSKEMSPLNFWGYVIWRCSSPAVKKLIGKKHAAELFRHVRKVPANWWRFLHIDLSYGKDAPIDWEDHLKTLKVLQHFPAMNIERINSLLAGVFRYDQLEFDAQVKLLNKLYFYITQFIPTSPLLFRIRAIQHNLLLNASGENYQMVAEMKLLQQVNSLVEDDAAGGAGGGAAGGTGAAAVGGGATATATTAGAIASYALPVGNGKLIRRVKRREWQAPKFQNPYKVKKP